MEGRNTAVSPNKQHCAPAEPFRAASWHTTVIEDFSVTRVALRIAGRNASEPN
jgi:hypothetical protein